MENRDISLAKQAMVRALAMQREGKTLDDYITALGTHIYLLQEEHKPLCPYVEAAMEKFRYKEGELEVDESAVVSAGCDDGAYVQAWVWITNEEAGFPSIYEEEDCA